MYTVKYFKMMCWFYILEQVGVYGVPVSYLLLAVDGDRPVDPMAEGDGPKVNGEVTLMAVNNSDEILEDGWLIYLLNGLPVIYLVCEAFS